jgi:hypothetical protein
MPAKDTRTKNQKNDEIDKFNELELQADMLELRKCVQRLENYENDQLFMGSLEDIADAAKQLESVRLHLPCD